MSKKEKGNEKGNEGVAVVGDKLVEDKPAVVKLSTGAKLDKLMVRVRACMLGGRDVEDEGVVLDNGTEPDWKTALKLIDEAKMWNNTTVSSLSFAVVQYDYKFP